MFVGVVVGRVWASKKLDTLPPRSLLEIEVEADQRRIVAVDPLCCGEGERVLVVTGSVASQGMNGATIDALIVASLESDEG